MLKKPQASNTATIAGGTTNEVGSADVIQEWADATLKTSLSLDPKSYIPELFWAHKTRPDGRIFGQARQTSVTPGVLQRNALGSALVKLTASAGTTAAPTQLSQGQSTHVLAGVTADIGQPSATEGDLKITVTPTNATLESWLQRLILKVMDLEQLGIVGGKAAFGLDVTIAVLNQDGNVTDACLLAAVAALQNAVLPPIVVKDGRVFTLESDEELKELPESLTTFPSKKLCLPVIPLPLSMGVMTTIPPPADSDNTAKTNQHWLIDPSGEEEMVCQGAMTIVVDGMQRDNVLSLEYQGEVSMSHADLALALQMAKGRAEELLPLMN